VATLTERFTQLLGPQGVLLGDDMQPLTVDHRKVFHGAAEAVVRPSSSGEVAEVLRLCSEYNAVVVPQGGNTGLSGGATPQTRADDTRPVVVLSLTRMNRVEAVEPNGWTATVEAGVTIQQLQEAAADHNRLFAPDWGARGSATIGGAIATDAGGTNVMRYGNMREQVLGLEVVLADGRIWDGMRSLRKDSSGYDLKSLFIGSEGTLGVVTRAVVRLMPATPHRQSALAALNRFDDLPALFDLVRREAPDIVTAFEMIPEVGLARACDVFGFQRPLQEVADVYALIKVASSAPVGPALETLLQRAADAGLISDAVVAGTPRQEEELWAIRDALPAPTIYPETQAAGVKLDTAVPLQHVVAFYRAVCDLAQKLAPEALAYGFGHVGDGNIHMMVLPTDVDHIDSFLEVRAELESGIDAATFALGGTLSAEHGIGQLLTDRIRHQKPPIEWELMDTLKATLDPENRLNPGILLPPKRQH
jgi:FAD/FMN-containing dehydrogenase